MKLNFFKRLPHCDTLFKIYLDKWYHEEDRRGMTRPDVYVIPAYQGFPIDIDQYQYLTPEALDETRGMIQRMVNAAKKDFQDIVEFDDFSIEIVDKIDKYHNKDKVLQIIKNSNPEDFSNDYLITICEFGSMLGYILTQNPDFKWLYSYPYFNSIVVHQPTGTGVTVFDWAVKKFSSYGLNDGFAAKLTHVLGTINEGLTKSRY